ncbi:hypothetical protein AVEN_228883-1 [Araneus ventricosus]|uniref:Uncharacterized protein n=1 Tax=Araneus ventricosus TaxID=182803 RepID=A0A4Y2NW54_ARAVE|nr:hypothetical protein AVEN_228883-1 [Araneus ventricosus]
MTEENIDSRRTACEFYAKERARYRRKLLKTRRKAWKRFCTEAANPYGRTYNAIFENGRPPSDLFQHTSEAVSEIEIAESILHSVYPQTHRPQVQTTTTNTTINKPFTIKEITTIVNKLNKK